IGRLQRMRPNPPAALRISDMREIVGDRYSARVLRERGYRSWRTVISLDVTDRCHAAPHPRPLSRGGERGEVGGNAECGMGLRSRHAFTNQRARGTLVGFCRLPICHQLKLVANGESAEAD